ncbi:MAG: hypothetical protein EZS28_007759 [Streblomastix strix]|uniref:Uncharacterized protein n=1 Tax=Streblomastix strix TaxID=222440 RepID=A0A5J4WPT9_9EUKA|nr:MAG: hypothetical protein EZS28_007759 [Streblomastix strix]
MPWTSTSPKLRTEEEVKKMVQLEYDEEQLRAVEAGLVTWIVQDLGIDILKNQKNKNKKDTKKNVKMNNEDEQIELEQQREQIVTFDMLMVEFERGFILKKIVEKALSIQFDDQKVLRKDPNSYFFRGLDDNKDNKIKQKWRWKDEDTNEQDKERSLSRMSRRQNVEQVLKALKGKNMPYYRFLNHGSQISSGNRHAIVGLLEDIRQFSKDLAGFKQFQTSNCPM